MATLQQLEEIRRCAEQGISTRECAKRVGLHASAVSRAARRMGTPFGSVAVKQTEAMIMQTRAKAGLTLEVLRVRRLEHCARLHDVADEELAKRDRPYLETFFSPQKESVVEHWRSEGPGAHDSLAFVKGATSAINAACRIFEADQNNQELDQARGELSVLAAFMKAEAGRLGEGDYDLKKEMAPALGNMLPPLDDAPTIGVDDPQ